MTGPSINYERLKQRRTEGSRGGAGWKPKEGDNRVRILPPHSKYLTAWSTMDDIAIGIEVHFFRMPGGEKQFEVTRCPKDLKLPCPACDAYWAHKDSSDPGYKEMASQVKSTRIYLMNILDIGNLQAGIQHWGGNYTCWDKILEIVANPLFGNVLDPANGINFTINLTPRNRSKSGFPQYDIQVERNGGPAGPALRTTVMSILEQIPNWQQKLDDLQNQMPPLKSADEISVLLNTLRIPPAAGQSRVPAVAQSFTPPAGAVVAPAPVSAPVVQPAVQPAPVAPPAQVMPVGVPPAVPQAVPVAAPQPVVLPVAEAAAPVVVTGFTAPQPVAVARAAVQVHYDPGPNYVPKVPDGLRPVGAPRCFGDYDSERHACNAPCPVKGSCQVKMLGVGA